MFLSDPNYIEEVEWIKETQKGGFLYLYCSGYSEYKIGISKDVLRRESELNANNPNGFMLWHTHRKDYKNTEKALHKFFEKKRIRGQWFNLTPIEVLKLLTMAYHLRPLAFDKILEGDKETLYLMERIASIGFSNFIMWFFKRFKTDENRIEILKDAAKVRDWAFSKNPNA